MMLEFFDFRNPSKPLNVDFYEPSEDNNTDRLGAKRLSGEANVKAL